MLHLIGDGIPSRILSAAKDMEVEEELKKLGDQRQNAVKEKNFVEAKKIQEDYDECCAFRETLPDLFELNSKVSSLNMSMKHAMCQNDFDKACKLQEEIASLEEKIRDEEDARRRLNGAKCEVSHFETRTELEAQISTVRNKIEKAAQDRDFTRAQEMQQMMPRLEKLRASLPTSAELIEKIRTTRSEMNAASVAQNFLEADNQRSTLQLLEEQLYLEEAAEGKFSVENVKSRAGQTGRTKIDTTSDVDFDSSSAVPANSPHEICDFEAHDRDKEVQSTPDKIMSIRYPLMTIKDIRVKVRNPNGFVSIEVDFDEILWSGTVDYVRRKTLRGGHTTAKGGWRNMFTHEEPYTTTVGGIVKVDMRESGPWGKWQRGKIQEKIVGPGHFEYEYEDLRVEFNVKKKE